MSTPGDSGLRSKGFCTARAIAIALAGSLLALSCGLLHAQQAPDAGTILRQQPKPPTVPASKPAAPRLEKPDAGVSDEKMQAMVLVKGFRIKGNRLIAEAELVAQLHDFVSKEVRFGQLRNAVLQLIGYYAQKGYIARAFLPPQEIRDGVVEIQVVEGTRGTVSVERKGNRVDAERVRRFVEARAPAGATLDMAAVGEALNILNEQPGVEVSANVTQGKTEGAVDLSVLAADKPLAIVDLGLNNLGAKATGTGQAVASLTLANPFGLFDVASVLVNKSEGTTFVRGDYSLAVGDRGLRLGVTGSSLTYRLVQPGFAALQPSGTARTAGLKASYPLVRRSDLSLTLDGGIDGKEFIDQTVAGETGDRRVRVANAGLNGYTVSGSGSGLTVITFGASAYAGSLNQRNATAFATDAAARNTQGSYSKLTWDLGLLRTFGANWSLTGTLRGQHASKNLDSSERITLGGANAVRAYPVGEAVGDEGLILRADLKYRLADAWRVGGFFDAGHIKQNHTIPPAGVVTPNSYSLSGAGLALEWLPSEHISFSVMLAKPVGNNAGKSATGTNVDGSRSNGNRAWLSLTAKF